MNLNKNRSFLVIIVLFLVAVLVLEFFGPTSLRFVGPIGIALGILAGWSFFRVIAHSAGNSLPVAQESAEEIVRAAHRQKSIILEEALRATKEELEEENLRREEELAVVRRLQETCEQDLSKRQSEIDIRSNGLDAEIAALSTREGRLEELANNAVQVENERKNVIMDYVQHLELKANTKRVDLESSLAAEILDNEKLSISRSVMDKVEEVKFDSPRWSREVLNTVLARYCPTFIWPKTTFTVSTPSRTIAEEHFIKQELILNTLIGESGINAELIADPENPDNPPVIKLSGGSGVDKEVIRLTLEEMLAKNIFSPERAKSIAAKHQKSVDKYIAKIGEQAARALGLGDIHPEILKLVGSLSFRTSHRQNQYYHSLEVAVLAGILADELGVDRKLAKRAGFLHDIGKALDYKIEGSHAVISADVAAQHGESQEVVDVILAHHDDKIAETPLAYILKAADALSGARPGARVDMEEGYHKRIDAISDVINSFTNQGVAGSAIMHAGREVHVFVDNRKIKERDIQPLAINIVRKLEAEVEFPGQIRVTVVRRTEVTEVA